MKSLKLKIFWKSHVISLLLIANHAREVPMIPYLSRYTAGIWPWEAFGLCSRSQIVMLGRRQTIFLTPYLNLKRDLIFDSNIRIYDLLCLLSWHHGKQRKLSWKGRGILLSDFCGNPE